MDYNLPGIIILHQKLVKRFLSRKKDKVSQFLKGKLEKIPEHPPVSVGPIQQIPFGCIWGKKEASCIFVTGKFFKFLRQFVDFVDGSLISIASKNSEMSNNVEELSNDLEILPNNSETLSNVLSAQ
ncbi:unnamed protein product [Cylicocyclus nassatus]|uniref:Uncharacterized protein n=1 Tax=Cylicocyclus nassatus TaxID=53992 RepID=A0AA36DNE2_CYLNA|nr:unnamed protein product [Cylicocyclus nassatus]